MKLRIPTGEVEIKTRISMADEVTNRKTSTLLYIYKQEKDS